jgi:mono/diheme cytochrome c family protein
MAGNRLARWRGGLALILALACAACASDRAGPSRTAEAANGQAFVERSCAGCHAVGVSGESRDTHAPPFRELARSRSDAALAAALAQISRNGHVEMPPIYVTPAEQAQVLAYLRGLRAQPVRPDPAALRGREIANTHCAGCHAVGAKGASRYAAAPPLRTLARAWSPAALQLRLERSPLHTEPAMPPHELTPREADDLAAYILALQTGQDLGRRQFTGPICNPVYWC